MNTWKSIFMQSRVNNGYYQEEGLPQQAWEPFGFRSGTPVTTEP